MRLLIVEDDVETRSILDEVLSESHSVTSVATAREALAAKPERFDLIVTDYRLPVMCGLELNQVLRDRGVAVPVVLMSADPDVGSRATLAGFCEYLAKPFDFSQLEAVLGRVGADARSLPQTSFCQAKAGT